MYCPICNTQNRDDAKFCKSCGHSLPAGSGEHLAAPNPAQEDVGSQFAISSPASLQGEVGAQHVVPTDNVEETEDPGIAPTQIISPERMVAYHSRRWQQLEEREQPERWATTSETQATTTATATSSADAPDVLSAPAPATLPSQEQPAQEIADIPTVRMMPSSEDENVPIPPPPPPPLPTNLASNLAEAPETDSLSPTSPSPQTAEATGMTGEVAGTAEATTQEEGATMQQKSFNQSEQPEQAAPAPKGDFAALPVGTLMLGRYEITQLISSLPVSQTGFPQEHIYQVIDRQGYQHCWNCGSEQNAEGDEFCTECGASMLNVPYIMHEYPPAAALTDEQSEGESNQHDAHDAHVLQGNIMHTFVEQGRTYVIEQPQSADSAFPNGIHLLAAADSDAGDIRRSEPNEDSTLILQLQRVHESIAVPSGVFIVADGLGGHDNGQVASRITINVIAERMVRELLDAPLSSEKAGGPGTLPDEDGLVAMLRDAIEDANTTLVQMNQRDKTDMGSTITGFMIVGDHAYVINVGDSRTYMMRGKQLYQLTADHSLVAQLVAGGLIEPDDIYTHPQRSQIFRSLGDKPNVQIDVFKQQLHPGDIMLSCSDGLWEMVRNPQIESILNEAPNPQTACTQLIEAANTNGGEDNISAVVVLVQ